jgi:hypothetical protein
VLALVFTQARGPMIGLASGLAVFLAMVFITMGWRSAVRGIILFSLAAAFSWAVINLGPLPVMPPILLPPAGRDWLPECFRSRERYPMQHHRG